MSQKMVLVGIEYLINLEQDSLKLEILENGGVDNWEWYGESLYPSPEYSDTSDYDAQCEEIRDRIYEEYQHEITVKGMDGGDDE